MNVITITREYGAGGGEVARKLAEALGWELLDRELLHQAAEIEHVPDADLERLDEKAISMADRFRLHPPHQKYLHGLKAAAQRRPNGATWCWWAAAHGTCWASGPTRFTCGWWPPKTWRAQRMAQLEGWSLGAGPWPAARKWTASGTLYRVTSSATRRVQPAQYDLVFNTAARSAG